jgi:hypothetical protein
MFDGKYGNLERWFLGLVTIFLLLFVSSELGLSSAFRAVATIQKLSGTATVVRQGQTMPATTGLEIWENDTLRTGPDGSIGLVCNDETLLFLGPESVFIIDEFVCAPREGKFSIVFRMLKGTVPYLSGLISKLALESAHFKTPTASIGIRGTKFIVKVEGK